MRTTLTVDDEVDGALREIAVRQHRSYKEVVNEALKRGALLLAENPPQGAYQVMPLVSGFQPGVDQGKLNQLSDELEMDP